MDILFELFYEKTAQMAKINQLINELKKSNDLFKHFRIGDKIKKEEKILRTISADFDKFLEDGTIPKNKRDLSVLADHEKSTKNSNLIIPHLEVQHAV